MIVTVCYGDGVRIVVPCGDGSLKVDELKELANERYNKHKGRPRESPVPVHHLQTQSGILDPDDELHTVVSNKEEIFVFFDNDPRVPQGGGDGASGSSAGTGSPDIFRGPPDSKYDNAGGVNALALGAGGVPHIEVTSTSSVTSAADNVVTIGAGGPPDGLMSSGGLSMLQVRRSSDPSLNMNGSGGGGMPVPQDPTKRWSAAAVCRSDQLLLLGDGGASSTAGGGSSAPHRHHHLSPSWEDELELMDDSGGHHPHHQHHYHQQQQQEPADSLQPNQFSRSGRLSMQFLGPEAAGGYKWIDAAERATQAYNSKSLPRDAKRKEPLGQAYESIREKNDEMLLIVNATGGPLGLTAVPDPDNGGLLVQHVEQGGCAERGRLRRGDRILEINGTKLVGLSEQSVTDHLRRCCAERELRVRVIRATTMVKRLQRELGEAAEAERGGGAKVVAHVSPTKKAAQTAQNAMALQTANTRKIGRKIVIALRKGPHGLGFSVTTRDNPAGGQCPIYIKTILPRGAAIVDGRLKPGDRLLEVDGVSMTGRTQSDVVQILRATQPEATVEIVVSRQQEAGATTTGAAVEEVAERGTEKQVGGRDEREIAYDNQHEPDSVTPPKPPAPIFPHKSALKQPQAKRTPDALTEQNVRRHFIEAGSESVSSTDSGPRKREILTLHIPVHDTEKAGLGVSVKGKTGSNNSSSNGSNSTATASTTTAGGGSDGDIGIYVKSVLNGGAASLDGRLRMNDQLLYVNEISLLDQSNEEAMETLRKAMLQRSSTHPGMITLTVSRRIGSRPHSQMLHLDGGGATTVNGGNVSGVSVNGSFDISHTRSVSSTSEQSGKTVIYLSSEKLEDGTSGGGGKGMTNGGPNCRWSNPVLDRLTGGTGGPAHHHPQNNTSNSSPHGGPPPKHQKPTAAALQQQREYALRNESYYMATNETWSPGAMMSSLHQQQQQQQHLGHINNSVLIEEDPEPPSPTIPLPMRNPKPDHHQPHHNHTNTSITSTANTSHAHIAANGADATYDSQLSLDTNPDAFSRDAIGRRSMSEKHHAALDAKETGTYQRNKKAREQREQREHERRVAHFRKGPAASGGSTGANLSAGSNSLGSMESLTASGTAAAKAAAAAMAHEAMDRVGELGPSLGLKKSSSLESLQTMVQEIQMSDEPSRGPTALRTPRGRGREEALRAAVESRPEANKPRKHWLLEDGPSDTEGGFINRHGPFQGSLNEGKPKAAAAAAGARTKKPGGGLLKGIGHMFRFGKHRKDGIAPTETHSDLGQTVQQQQQHQQQQQATAHGQPIYQTRSAALASEHRPPGGPPNYQPPPPVGAPVATANVAGFALHQNDPTFSQRYAQSVYVNHGELQQQLGHSHHLSAAPQVPPPSSSSGHPSPISVAHASPPPPPSASAQSPSDLLSDSTIAQMRMQVMQQRFKVEEESRRNQHYHSQRSVSSRKIDYNHLQHHNGAQLPHATLQQLQAHHQQQQQQHHPHHLMRQSPPTAAAAPSSRSGAHPPPHHLSHPHHGGQQRPVSSYYGEYETVQKYQQQQQQQHQSSVRKTSAPSSPLKLNGSLGSSGRYQHQPQQQRL